MSGITIKIYRTPTVITVINYRHPFVRQDPSLFEKGPGEYKFLSLSKSLAKTPTFGSKSSPIPIACLIPSFSDPKPISVSEKNS